MRGKTVIVALLTTFLFVLFPQYDAGPSGAGTHFRYPDAFPVSVYPHNNPEFTRDDMHPGHIYRGPTFRLSQHYPSFVPFRKGDYPWLSINFKDRKHSRYRDYLRAVLRCAYRDNLKNNWYLADNARSNWFHAPWLHLKEDSSHKAEREPIYLGREFIHGLTYELPSESNKLSPTQSGARQNWAIGFYNAQGARTIGRVWKKIQQGQKPSQKDCLFLPGAVAVKLIFTEAGKKDLPSLAGAPEWDAHIFIPKTETTDDGIQSNADYAVKGVSVHGTEKIYAYQRTVKKLRLLQIDIAVRDPRADPLGWVFGTLVYAAPHRGSHRRFTGIAQGRNLAWDDVVPVGLTWGNDPAIVPGSARPLQETRRNEQAPLYSGWGGRLNGPVDNAQSSCLSCHGTAQTERIPNYAFSSSWKLPEYMSLPYKVFAIYQKRAEGDIPPAVRAQVTRAFFRNPKRGEPFISGKISTDFSLQLTEGIRNYGNAASKFKNDKHFHFAAPPQSDNKESSLSPREGQ